MILKQKTSQYDPQVKPIFKSDDDWIILIMKNNIQVTLQMKSGATSGVPLNSPHTCKSLMQQIASLSSVRLWEPIMSRVMWGRM